MWCHLTRKYQRIMTPITIIGGGLAALSTAWASVRNGHSVDIFWMARKGAGTNAAAGMLSPFAEADTAEPPLIELALKSCAAYPDWINGIEQASGISCEYRTSGTILAALSRDHMADLHRLAQFHHRFGLKTQWLSRKELFDHEPNIASRQVGGIWAKNDHSVNPRQLQYALFKALEKENNVTITEAQSIHIVTNGQKVENVVIKVNNQQLIHKTSQVVLCDGSWKNCAADLLNPLPLRPVKGQYVIVKGSELIFHTMRSPDIYMVPRRDGQVYIGASMEEEGFKNQPSAGAQLDLLYHSWQLFRGVYELDVIEHGFGFRPALRDHQPAIGPSPIEGLFLNTGHFRHGVMLAPLAAELCVQFLHEPAMESPFSPLRFWS
ncbi:MAG: glycine oxidase ThiO [Myxococcota bacterium]